MPQYTVEVTHYIPVYQHITIEAADTEDACVKAIDTINTRMLADDPVPARVDYENQSADFITGIWHGDEAYNNAQEEVPAEYCRDYRLMNE